MDEWYDFDEDFWDEYYGAEDDTNLATLANDLAESTVPDINWSVFDENPTSRDLQLFDWEDDWILFEFDHDEYYDIRSSSIRPAKSSSSSCPPTPYPAMDEEAATTQLHHDPIPSSAKDAAAAMAATDPAPMTDDTDEGIDGGLRKKRPDVQISQPSLAGSDKKNVSGQSSRSQSTDRTGSIGSRSRRSRTPIPNPNTGPQPGEELEVLHEDDEKKVVIVHTGGILGKLRVIRKDTVQPAPSVAAGPGPSKLRNAVTASSESSSKPETVDLVVEAPTPK